MIVQVSNKKLELLQLLMGVLVFTIFITYSLREAFQLSPLIIWSSIFFQAGGIILTIRKMMGQRTVVKPYIAWEEKKLKVLQPNWAIRIISFTILTLLGGFHFYIVDFAGNDLMPLVYDYGIGGFGAIVIQILLARKWNIGISDKGIIFGSKYDSKLIPWQSIKSYENNNQQITIHCKKDASFKLIAITPQKQLKEILALLDQAIN